MNAAEQRQKDLEKLMEMFDLHFSEVVLADQASEGLREVTTCVDCKALADDPDNQASLEWLYMAVMVALCLETENEAAGSYIGMIAECKEQYRQSVSEFLENKVLKYMDEKGEHHTSPHDHKQHSQEFDLSAGKHHSDFSRGGRDEVVALLEQIKMNEKTIARLEDEVQETRAVQELLQERNDELAGQLDGKDNEIIRLTDAMSRLAEAVCLGCYLRKSR